MLIMVVVVAFASLIILSVLTRMFSFDTRDLVTIGLFAGAAKAASLTVSLLGGGMNPVTLILKNAVWTALWVILLVKVRKPGVLTLGNIIAALLGVFLLGSTILTLPAVLIACLAGEAVILAVSGFAGRLAAVSAGIIVCEFISKALQIAVTFIVLREQPALLIPGAAIILIGYTGVFLGIYGGIKMIKELRHAGLIRH